MTKDTCHRVLELFSKYRKSPGAEFDDSHFLDYLLDKPKGKGAFRNSFSGLRRFNAFWDEVQLEFGVCFSINDRETDFSLEKYCDRIEQLCGSIRSSKASLRNRAKCGFEWNAFVFGNLLLVVLAFALKGFWGLSVLLLLGVIALNYTLVLGHVKERKYLRELETRIVSPGNT